MLKYSSNLAFIDLLFNLILGFAFLFIVAFLLINDPTETADIEANVEYMITMSWEGEKDIDLDLWIEGPSGLVGFRDPSQGFMNLDRDDLGHRTDTIFAGTDKMEVVHINQEIINIRGYQAGEYVINGHYFFTKEPKEKRRTTAEVKVIKLNPFEEVWQGTKEFEFRRQELTFVRFEMTPEGRYTNMHDLQKHLVMKPDGTGPGTGWVTLPNDENRNTRGSGTSGSITQQMQINSDPAYGGVGGP